MYLKTTFLNLKNCCLLVPAIFSLHGSYANDDVNVNNNYLTTTLLRYEYFQQTVSGTVTDAAGLPLPGATVLDRASNKSTVTDMDGKFQIDAPQGATLEITYVGYKAQTVTVSGSSVSVSLTEDSSELQEVVLIGYGNQSKKDVTGAVTQLSSDQFRQGVNISADNLLQGKVAGVRVVPTSGEPGAGINVSIRGIGSIRSGSTPLFVVDGVPLSNDDASPQGPNVGLGSQSAKNPLNFLNTSDIESITVLKDASAAAIYGARGSNGVVIITTKKGATGKASFTVDSYMGFASVANKIDVLSAGEYRSALAATGGNEAYDHGGNTDWQDVIYRTAVTQNNSFSFSKATDSGNYFVSLSQMDQEGVVEKSNFKRTTGRINAAESFLDNKRLRIKVNLTASETKDTGVPIGDDGGSDGQLIIHTLMANPTQPVFDENGDYTNFNMNAHYNPAYLLSIFNDETRTTRILGNAETSFRIINGLDYKLNLGIDRSMSERNTTIYPNLTDRSAEGRYIQGNMENKNALIEHYLTYNTTFGSHKIDALAGFSYQKFERNGTNFTMMRLNGSQSTGIDPANNPAFFGSQANVNGYAQVNKLQSYFGRVNYTFADKYLFTASLRADGSTRFGKNNKYGYFPSFAAGWNLSQESFLQQSTVVNNLKLRVSWGQTGNQEVQNKLTQASYALLPAEGYYLYDDLELVNGVYVARTPNPDLKWEVVTQYNIGADFNLWGDKLYGTLDYFNKTTTDAILNIPSIPLSPTPTVWRNVGGKIVNTGVELMLGSKIIDTNDFTWSVDANGATLHNEIQDLPVSEILSGAISGPGQSGVLANIYKSGYSAGSFYLRRFTGFDDDGLPTYEDTNGDGVSDNNDRQIIESALPKLSYGINTNLRYKAFDLSLSFIGQSGGYLLNNTGLNALNINNLASDRNVATDYYESGASPSVAPVVSTLYLESSDFLRLNSARIGYTFKHPGLNWLDSLNIYATGTNLFTITPYTGYDPLINSPKSSGGNQSIGIDYGAYPTTRTFILGATLKL